MIAFPNAKINIGLHIVSKRHDGYHNLETTFFPIKWNDVLEIIPSQKDSFSSTGLEISGDIQNNLCVKALNLLRNDFQIPPVDIHLHKIIPMGAGLGGGSSDAAYMLKLLNDKFELKINDENLLNYARKLGSDCAFFIKNTPVYATEKGDVFSDLQLDLSNYNICVVHPQIHVSTAEAYSNVKPRNVSTSLKNDILRPIEEWKDYIFNDFETSVFEIYPKIEELKMFMYQSGAIYAAMSGSGSAVFGIFKNELVLPNFSSFGNSFT